MTETENRQPDESLLQAWNAWRNTEEFISVLSWAEDLLHIRENGAQGELWTAFCAGYRAAGGQLG